MHANKSDIKAVKMRNMWDQIHKIRALIAQLASMLLLLLCSRDSDIPLPRKHAPSSHTMVWFPGRCENNHFRQP